MEPREITYNYTREAFMHPINLAVLLGATVTSFFLNDVGMLAPLILTVSFGAELLYLGSVPRLEAFQRWVRVERMKDLQNRRGDKEMFSKLNKSDQKRFLVLKHLSKLIKENFDKLPYTSQGLLQNIHKKLEGLLINYLNLLDAYSRYGTFLNASADANLKQEIKEEKEKLNGIESEKLRQVKARRLYILVKRYERLQLAKEKYAICVTQLETLEDTVKYIYEQSITMNNPEEIGFQLDNLINEVEETSNIFAELEAESPSFGLIDDIDSVLETIDHAGQKEQMSSGEMLDHIDQKQGNASELLSSEKQRSKA